MLLFALLWACSDIAINEVKQPEIIVAPTTLDFGHLLSGYESDTMTVTIANGGGADLVIDRLEINGENYFVDTNGFVVPAGGWYQIDVGYAPVTFEHNEGYMDIYLEGDEEPSEGVWLNGNGDAPVISVTPAELDFGSPLLGCDTTTEILIQNDGNVDLIIDDIDIMASVPPDITIEFGSLPEFPWILEPAARIEFFANYSPLDESNDLTIYDISSSDPLTPVFNALAEGSAVLSNEVIQKWLQDSKLIVDIIWVIDNSGSMSTYQSMLGQNMADFMQVFLSYSPDFQISFITTDSPLLIGHISSRSTLDPLNESVAAINSIGVTGSGWEKGLQMLRDCMLGGECVTWMRHDATLIAIFLSDEPDNSPFTVSSFIADFDSVKPDKFIPYAIIGDVPQGCPSNTGWNTQPGWGYYDIVQHYGSQWWSICGEDWGTKMEEIALEVSIQTVFELDSEDPHLDTIRVWINGQIVTSGWEYDESLNAVVFEYEDAPEHGDTLEVGYSSWGCDQEQCPEIVLSS